MTETLQTVPAQDGTAADWELIGLPHDCGKHDDAARQRYGCNEIRETLECLVADSWLPMSIFSGRKLVDIFATLKEKGVVSVAVPSPRTEAGAAVLVAR